MCFGAFLLIVPGVPHCVQGLVLLIKAQRLILPSRYVSAFAEPGVAERAHCTKPEGIEAIRSGE